MQNGLGFFQKALGVLHREELEEPFGADTGPSSEGPLKVEFADAYSPGDLFQGGLRLEVLRDEPEDPGDQLVIRIFNHGVRWGGIL
jgi:hypothetical protein